MRQLLDLIRTQTVNIIAITCKISNFAHQNKQNHVADIRIHLRSDVGSLRHFQKTSIKKQCRHSRTLPQHPVLQPAVPADDNRLAARPRRNERNTFLRSPSRNRPTPVHNTESRNSTYLVDIRILCPQAPPHYHSRADKSHPARAHAARSHDSLRRAA